MRKNQTSKAHKTRSIREITNEELFIRLSKFEEFRFKCRSCNKENGHELKGKNNKAYLQCSNPKCGNTIRLTPTSRHFLEEKLRSFLRQEFEVSL